MTDKTAWKNPDLNKDSMQYSSVSTEFKSVLVVRNTIIKMSSFELYLDKSSEASSKNLASEIS